MTAVLLVAAVVGSGVLAGGMFLFAVGVNPGLTAISDGSFKTVFSRLDHDIDRFMPRLTGVTAVLALTSGILHDGSARVLLLAGAAAAAGVAVISASRIVPLKKVIKSAEGESLCDCLHRWTVLHSLRTCSGTASAVLIASGAAVT